jgi:DNA (cytosine-5)-methyltransferase 1
MTKNIGDIEMRILNLFGGIGANRSPWGEKHVIVTVEHNQQIAYLYYLRFPKDIIIIADAYDYVLKHFMEFDFIWASPPCNTHTFLNVLIVSKMDRGFKAKLPDLQLYSLVIFLKRFFKGLWIVENVKPYYEPLIKPSFQLGRHIFWSNFHVEKKEFREKEYTNDMVYTARVKQVDLDLINKFNCKSFRKDQLLRNAVNPKISAHIFKYVEKKSRMKQTKLSKFDMKNTLKKKVNVNG